MENFLRRSSRRKNRHNLHFHWLIPLVFFLNILDMSISDCVSTMCENFEICTNQFQDSQHYFVEKTRVYTECCDLCAMMEKCTSFNYDVETHMCSLFEETSETFIGRKVSTINGKYTKTSQQDSKHVCRSRPCNSDQVCVTTTSGHGHVCLKGSTCSDAPRIDNMTLENIVQALTSVQANYTCDTGFQRISGSGQIVCTEDGKWTAPSLVCTEIDCGQPPAKEHQNAGFVTSTLYLDRAEYTCETGYSPTEGSGTSQCQTSGNWSVPTLKCQVISCGQPSSRQHQTVNFVNTSVYLSSVDYRCDIGYNRSEGSGTSTCQADGMWSVPTLKCLAIDCGNPPSHSNTEVSVVSSTLYSSSTEYSCDTGYRQTEGKGTSTCEADGLWSVPTLKCEVVDCGMPDDVEHMDMDVVDDTTYMSNVTFSCSTGFTSDGGDPTIKCLADGTWSDVILKCNIVDCGMPPSSDVNLVNVQNTTYQSVAHYQCGLGFSTLGNGTSVCQEDGQWSDTCQDIPDLRAISSLDASAGDQMQCRNVLSNPVPDPDWDYRQSVTCNEDEILTGCSAIAEDGTQMYGSWVSTSLRCYTDTTVGSQSVARCCKISSIQCEYIRSVTTSASCYKDFQLLDCSCSGSSSPGYCLTTMTNNSCLSHSDTEAFRYAVCCTYDQLVCYVKEIPVRASFGELSTTCGTGETMTACSAFNKDREIQKALIEERNGVDTCVVDPGDSSLATLKAYMSCCK